MRTRDLAKPSGRRVPLCEANTASATHRERERAARRLRLAESYTRRGHRDEAPRTLRAYVHQLDREGK